MTLRFLSDIGFPAPFAPSFDEGLLAALATRPGALRMRIPDEDRPKPTPAPAPVKSKPVAPKPVTPPSKPTPAKATPTKSTDQGTAGVTNNRPPKAPPAAPAPKPKIVERKKTPPAAPKPVTKPKPAKPGASKPAPSKPAPSKPAPSKPRPATGSGGKPSGSTPVKGGGPAPTKTSTTSPTPNKAAIRAADAKYFAANPTKSTTPRPSMTAPVKPGATTPTKTKAGVTSPTKTAPPSNPTPDKGAIRRMEAEYLARNDAATLDELSPAERQRLLDDQAALEREEQQARDRNKPAEIPTGPGGRPLNRGLTDDIATTNSSRATTANEEIVDAREEYFENHDTWVDVDGTVYAASLDARGNIVLDRDQRIPAEGQNPALDTSRGVTIATDRSREDVAVTRNVPTGAPNEVQRTRTETSRTNADGTPGTSQIREEQEQEHPNGSSQRSLVEENYGPNGVATDRVQEQESTSTQGDVTLDRVETDFAADGTTPTQTVNLHSTDAAGTEASTSRETTTYVRADGTTPRQTRVVDSGTDLEGEPLTTTTANTEFKPSGEPNTTYISRDGENLGDTPASEYVVWGENGTVDRRLTGGNTVSEYEYSNFVATGEAPSQEDLPDEPNEPDYSDFNQYDEDGGYEMVNEAGQTYYEAIEAYESAQENWETQKGEVEEANRQNSLSELDDPNSIPGAEDAVQWTRGGDDRWTENGLGGNLVEPLEPSRETPSVFEVPAAVRARANAAAIDQSAPATSEAAFNQLDQEQAAYERQLAGATTDDQRERIMSTYFADHPYYIDRGTGPDAQPVLMASAWSQGNPSYDSDLFGSSRALSPHATMARTDIQGENDMGQPATIDVVRNQYTDGTQDEVVQTTHEGPAGAARTTVVGEHTNAAGVITERDSHAESQVVRTTQGLPPLSVTEISRERFNEASGKPEGEQYFAVAQSDHLQTALEERRDIYGADGIIDDTQIESTTMSRNYDANATDDFLADNAAAIEAAASDDYSPNDDEHESITLPPAGSSYVHSETDIDYDAQGVAIHQTVAEQSRTVEDSDADGGNGIRVTSTDTTRVLGGPNGTTPIFDETGAPAVDEDVTTHISTSEFDPDAGVAGGNKSEGHQYRQVTSISLGRTLHADGTSSDSWATPLQTDTLNEGFDDDWQFERKYLKTDAQGQIEFNDDDRPIELGEGDEVYDRNGNRVVKEHDGYSNEGLDFADNFEEFMEGWGGRIVGIAAIVAGIGGAVFTGGASLALTAVGVGLASASFAYTAINYSQGEASGWDLALSGAGVVLAGLPAITGVKQLVGASRGARAFTAARAAGAADDVARGIADDVLRSSTQVSRGTQNTLRAGNTADNAMDANDGIDATRAALQGDFWGAGMMVLAIGGGAGAGRVRGIYNARHGAPDPANPTNPADPTNPAGTNPANPTGPAGTNPDPTGTNPNPGSNPNDGNGADPLRPPGTNPNTGDGSGSGNGNGNGNGEGSNGAPDTSVGGARGNGADGDGATGTPGTPATNQGAPSVRTPEPTTTGTQPLPGTSTGTPGVPTPDGDTSVAGARGEGDAEAAPGIVGQGGLRPTGGARPDLVNPETVIGRLPFGQGGLQLPGATPGSLVGQSYPLGNTPFNQNVVGATRVNGEPAVVVDVTANMPMDVNRVLLTNPALLYGANGIPPVPGGANAILANPALLGGRTVAVDMGGGNLRMFQVSRDGTQLIDMQARRIVVPQSEFGQRGFPTGNPIRDIALRQSTDPSYDGTSALADILRQNPTALDGSTVRIRRSEGAVDAGRALHRTSDGWTVTGSRRNPNTGETEFMVQRRNTQNHNETLEQWVSAADVSQLNRARLEGDYGQMPRLGFTVRNADGTTTSYPDADAASAALGDDRAVRAQQSLDAFHDWYYATHGRAPSGGRDVEVIFSRDPAHANTAFRSGDRIIIGETTDGRGAAFSPGVLAHESGHGILADATGVGGGRRNEASAIHEAIGDFYSSSFEQDWSVGRGFARDGSVIRDINTGAGLVQNYQSYMNQGAVDAAAGVRPHSGSGVLSIGLRNMQQRMGWQDTTSLVDSTINDPALQGDLDFRSFSDAMRRQAVQRWGVNDPRTQSVFQSLDQQGLVPRPPVGTSNVGRIRESNGQSDPNTYTVQANLPDGRVVLGRTDAAGMSWVVTVDPGQLQFGSARNPNNALVDPNHASAQGNHGEGVAGVRDGADGQPTLPGFENFGTPGNGTAAGAGALTQPGTTVSFTQPGRIDNPALPDTAPIEGQRSAAVVGEDGWVTATRVYSPDGQRLIDVQLGRPNFDPAVVDAPRPSYADRTAAWGDDAVFVDHANRHVSDWANPKRRPVGNPENVTDAESYFERSMDYRDMALGRRPLAPNVQGYARANGGVVLINTATRERAIIHPDGTMESLHLLQYNRPDAAFTRSSSADMAGDSLVAYERAARLSGRTDAMVAARMAIQADTNGSITRKLRNVTDGELPLDIDYAGAGGRSFADLEADAQPLMGIRDADGDGLPDASTLPQVDVFTGRPVDATQPADGAGATTPTPATRLPRDVVERAFNGMPVGDPRPVGNVGIEGQLYVYTFRDPVTNTTVEGLYKPESAAAPQEVFGGRAAEAFGLGEHVPYMSGRSDGGVIIEMLPGRPWYQDGINSPQALRDVIANSPSLEGLSPSARVEVIGAYDYAMALSDRHNGNGLADAATGQAYLIDFGYIGTGWAWGSNGYVTLDQSFQSVTSSPNSVFRDVTLSPEALDYIRNNVDLGAIRAAHADFARSHRPDDVGVSAAGRRFDAAASPEFMQSIVDRVTLMQQQGGYSFMNDFVRRAQAGEPAAVERMQQAVTPVMGTRDLPMTQPIAPARQQAPTSSATGNARAAARQGGWRALFQTGAGGIVTEAPTLTRRIANHLTLSQGATAVSATAMQAQQLMDRERLAREQQAAELDRIRERLAAEQAIIDRSTHGV